MSPESSSSLFETKAAPASIATESPNQSVGAGSVGASFSISVPATKSKT